METAVDASAAAQDASGDPPPDWDRFGGDLACPLCEYNLRGLPEPRCPECGYGFSWRELIESRDRAHPYLFEHHPRRSLWSFIRTYIGSLRPTRFWPLVHPAQPIRPVRIVLYWVLATGLIVLCAIPVIAQMTLPFWATGRWGWSDVPDIALYYVQELVYDNSGLAEMAMTVVAWPLMSLAALLVFQQSMRRGRIRFVHVMRCCAYSGDAALSIGMALVLLIPVMDWVVREVRLVSPSRDILILPAVLLAAITWYRLGRAYQLYLRFDRPFLTVLAAQVIVLLVVTILAVN